MNTDTKRHIDSARQVLVGVVPNPTSQIDQITNALIYKFMDDMDQAAIKSRWRTIIFCGRLGTLCLDTAYGRAYGQSRANEPVFRGAD